MDTYNTIYKEQYRLKLGFKNLLLTRFAFVYLVFCYFCFDGTTFYLVYGTGLTLYYKFFFNLTRNGFQLDSFIIKSLSKLNNKIRDKKRHR